ncbi:unnamed protein product [Linum trigynum]|uniref:Uncharacterized protein n=1 Tax=Linum trigynum TaxID=586398 RepID=A0AAV2FCT2_9ROSI
MKQVITLLRIGKSFNGEGSSVYSDEFTWGRRSFYFELFIHFPVIRQAFLLIRNVFPISNHQGLQIWELICLMAPSMTFEALNASCPFCQQRLSQLIVVLVQQLRLVIQLS